MKLGDEKYKCEVIDLAKYRAKREKEEIDEIYEEIAEIKQSILCMIDEMESPLGSILWEQDLIDATPVLRELIEQLEAHEEKIIKS